MCRPPLGSVYWSFILCITARNVREKLEEIAKKGFHWQIRVYFMTLLYGAGVCTIYLWTGLFFFFMSSFHSAPLRFFFLHLI